MNETTTIAALQQRVSELEAALEDSKQQEERLRMMIDRTTDWAWEVDANAVYKYVSPNIVNILGYTPEEIVGKTPFDLMSPEEAERVTEIFGPIVEARKPIIPLIENTLLHKKGHQLVMETSGSPFYHQDGTFAGYRGIYRDNTERKQQEQTLHMTQFIMDLAPDSIHWITMDGSIHYVNDSACTMLGYTREELLSMSILDLDPLVTEEQYQQLWQTVREQGTVRFETSHRHKDGHGIPLEIVSSYFEFEGRGFSCTFSRDISERKQQEFTLRMTQIMMQQASDSIYWLTPDETIHYANDAACTKLGYTREELLSKSVLDLDPLVTKEQYQHLWQTVRAQKTIQFETAHRHKDGHDIPVEIVASYLEFEGQDYVCIFARDITERKQAEQAMLRSQQILNAITNNLPVIIFMLDTEGIYTLSEGTPLEKIGLQQNEAVGISALDMYHDNPTVVANLKKALAGEPISYTSVIGNLIFDAWVVPMYDNTNQMNGVIGIGLDVSDARQAEAERTELQQQVIEVQQSALRELSTPLIPITDNVVIMPLIGTIDSQRAQQIMESLLEGVAQHQSTLAILDITGVQVVDTQVANAFIQAAQAVRLLGTQVMLTGIQPQVAQTLVQLGVDLSGIITKGSLQSGIKAALHNNT